MGNRIDAHTPNTVLAKKGLTEVIEQLCNYQHLCVYSTDGFQMPLLRQYPNRCAACYEATVPKLTTTKTTNVKILQAHASQKQKSCKANTQKPTRICSTFVFAPTHSNTLIFDKP